MNVKWKDNSVRTNMTNMAQVSRRLSHHQLDAATILEVREKTPFSTELYVHYSGRMSFVLLHDLNIHFPKMTEDSTSGSKRKGWTPHRLARLLGPSLKR